MVASIIVVVAVCVIVWALSRLRPIQQDGDYSTWDVPAP